MAFAPSESCVYVIGVTHVKVGEWQEAVLGYVSARSALLQRDLAQRRLLPQLSTCQTQIPLPTNFCYWRTRASIALITANYWQIQRTLAYLSLPSMPLQPHQWFRVWAVYPAIATVPKNIPLTQNHITAYPETAPYCSVPQGQWFVLLCNLRELYVPHCSWRAAVYILRHQETCCKLLKPSENDLKWLKYSSHRFSR